MNLTKLWAAPIDDYVIDIAWSPDGALLAAASAAGPIHLFDGPTGENRRQLPGHDDGANCLAFAPQVSGLSPQVSPSALLATGGQDGKVKFWDAANAQHTATADLGSAWVEQLAWRPTADAADRKSQILNTKSQTPVLAAAAGRQLAFLRADGSTLHSFKPAPKTLSAIAWHPQGGCLASAHFGGVCLWDADDFIAQKEFPYANGIHTLAWSPDRRWLVSGNADPSVHLWLPEDDQEFQMSGYETKVKQITFDHTSRHLATTGGSDVCVWDCSGAGPEGREPLMFPHDAPLCAVAFQCTHGLLASASTDGVVQLWSPERPQPLRATIKMPAPATKLVWSPDDRLLAVGSEKGILYILKVEA
jgi:WD40 repeat protein